jgi:hypothetical protein
LQQVKAERGWHTMQLPREAIGPLLADGTWYRLYAPESIVRVTGYAQTRTWREIVLALLTRYAERLWTQAKGTWEAERLELRELAADDPNLVAEYRVLVERSAEQVVAQLRQVEAELREQRAEGHEWSAFETIVFERHLYQPLLYARPGNSIQVRPVALNEGEQHFVRALKRFYEQNRGAFTDQHLYLLRNQSRGRGVGFFEAENFHPDFIVWFVAGERQSILFVDPKGLRNVRGPDDPKIAFHRTVKTLERRLSDPSVTLDSAIVSTTPYQQVAWWTSGERAFEDRHVFFRNAAGQLDVAAMLRKVLGDAVARTT